MCPSRRALVLNCPRHAGTLRAHWLLREPCEAMCYAGSLASCFISLIVETASSAVRPLVRISLVLAQWLRRSLGSTAAAVCAGATFERAAVSCSVRRSIRHVYRHVPRPSGSSVSLSIPCPPSRSSLVGNTWCSGEPALVASALTIPFVPS